MSYRKPTHFDPYPPVGEKLLAEISHLAGDHPAVEFDPENFPGYVVTANGQVWSVRKANSRKWGKPKQRKLHPYPEGGGFLTIGISDAKADGTLHTLSVSKIVAAAFIGEPPQPDMLVIHTDGDVKNNHVSNLAWASWQEFGENKAAHERMKAQGEQIGLAKLTDEEVMEIKWRAETETDEAIAKDFPVRMTTINRIRNGKIWRQTGGKVSRTKPLMPKGSKHWAAKLTESDVQIIRQWHKSGVSPKDLAAHFGVHVGSIYTILQGKTWTHVPTS